MHTKKHGKKRGKLLFLIADLVLLALLIAAVMIAQKREEELPAAVESGTVYHGKSVTHGEESVPVRRGLQSVLFIGTDNYQDKEKPREIEFALNKKRADFLVLMVYDLRSRTVTPMQISRDTFCDVPRLSLNGLFMGYEPMQIALAHCFGTGKEDSAENTVSAVSRLLCGAPIDSYFTFSMDVVPTLTNMMGGISVTLEDDMPLMGEEYTKGATVELKGKTALRFLRIRDRSTLSSNEARMSHHRLFTEAFAEKAGAMLAEDPDFVTKVYKKIEKYVCTDLTVQQLSQDIERYYDFEVLPTVLLPGTYSAEVLGQDENVVTVMAEFHPDEEALWACVQRLFCEER